jgi:uncharacterized membrane protein
MEYPSAARERKARSISTGVVLGLGLGGFADGIALHQIAQWHNMGSAKVPPITMEAMKQNMAWGPGTDGFTLSHSSSLSSAFICSSATPGAADNCPMVDRSLANS